MASGHLSRAISESEFSCHCCYELMVEPTTLTCGHNFCRLCVANWYLQSKKRECPECRQSWSGHPKVNLTLRTTIKALFDDKLAEREDDLRKDPANAVKITQFETLMKKQNSGWTGRNNNLQNAVGANGNSFWKGIGVALVCFLAYWTLGSFFVSDTDMSHKPVAKWNKAEVIAWLDELGPWATNSIAPVFQEKEIDGHLLVALEDADIMVMLPDIDELHMRAFSMAIFRLRELGVKPPADVSEYKTLHLGYSVFLLYALRNYPRTAILWLILFDYYDSFLPFIHVTCPVISDITQLNIYTFRFPAPMLSQWIDFVIKWLVFPYYLVGQFSWRSSTWFLFTAMLISCVAHTGMEAIGVRMVYKQNLRRTMTQVVVNHFKSSGGMLIFVLLWPIIPTFLIDFCFNFGLYYMPFFDMYTLYKLVMNS